MPLIQGNAKSAAGDFYSTEISQSLRFNDDDSAYLSWTPASAGNRKTWTWSGWVKGGDWGSLYGLFGVGGASSTPRGYFYLGSDTIGFYSDPTGSSVTAVGDALPIKYRDSAAWYHFVVQYDTTQATASNRIRFYVNGELLSGLIFSYPTQNEDGVFNTTNTHYIGAIANAAYPYNGYLAEVHFIDGTALDPTSFGENKSGVWIPKAYSGSYGTNGFYLPFNHDYSVEGFSAVTYRGNGGTQYIGGVGFEPDLVWIKSRSNAFVHALYDSVRGATKNLISNNTDSEYTYSVGLNAFNTDGFSLGGNLSWVNFNNDAFVAWCWDAGTGSPVSNTDGSITSTVKASTDYGFSIVSYTGNGSSSATVGHGLGSVPDMVICKRRDSATQWFVKHTDLSSNNSLCLNLTNAEFSPSDGSIADLSSSSTFGFYQGDNVNNVNASGGTYIAYCFSSVSGYSKIGSYSGTGSAGNKITTGFKPAFLMLKRSDSSGNNWWILDGVRDTQDPRTKNLFPNDSSAEIDNVGYSIDFDSDGFTIQATGGEVNNASGTYIYMAFADKREAAFWLDQSGNNNDFENNNLTESDISLDSPTNNFATLNPLAPQGYSLGTLSEGNLASIDNTTNSVVVAILYLSLKVVSGILKQI